MPSSGGLAIRLVLRSHSRSRRTEFFSRRTDCALLRGFSIRFSGSASMSRSNTEMVIVVSPAPRAISLPHVERLDRIEAADAFKEFLFFCGVALDFLAVAQELGEIAGHQLR